MPRFFIRPANGADNDVLCALSRVPMQGQISLAMERHLDFFAGAGVQNEAVEVNLCCDENNDGRIAAVFSTGRRRLYLDREPRWVRYLSDVRILPEYRGLAPLRLINNYIREREELQPSVAMQCIAFADNEAMLGVIRRRPPGVLRRMKFLWFFECGAYRTSAVSLTSKSRHHRANCAIRRATTSDLPIMAAFFAEEAPTKQCYPNYRFDRLGDPYYRGLSISDYFLAFDAGALVGITGIWDQQAFKQTRIAAYNGSIKWFRPLVNLVSRSLTGFSLPPAGTTLPFFYLHTILVKDNNPEVFRDLVEHIHGAYRGSPYKYFVCGLFTHDPLIHALDAFRARRDIAGQHYQIYPGETTHSLQPDQPMYLEAARI